MKSSTTVVLKLPINCVHRKRSILIDGAIIVIEIEWKKSVKSHAVIVYYFVHVQLCNSNNQMEILLQYMLFAPFVM